LPWQPRRNGRKKRKRQEEAAKRQADLLAFEAEKKRQAEAAAKIEAERLALEAEKKRQEEVARKEAERIALAAEKKRQEEVIALAKAPRPNDAVDAEATGKTDQPIKFPDLVVPAAVPETAAGPPVTGTQRPQVAGVPDKTATAVSADLPAFAPSRVVLTYPRDDKAAAERTTALRQALTAAKVEVVSLEAVDASRTTPSIGY
jgi:hypothetical protein